MDGSSQSRQSIPCNRLTAPARRRRAAPRRRPLLLLLRRPTVLDGPVSARRRRPVWAARGGRAARAPAAPANSERWIWAPAERPVDSAATIELIISVRARARLPLCARFAPVRVRVCVRRPEPIRRPPRVGQDAPPPLNWPSAFCAAHKRRREMQSLRSQRDDTHPSQRVGERKQKQDYGRHSAPRRRK